MRAQEGLTLEEVSRRFGVGVATVFRWTKTLESRVTRVKPATKIDMEALARDIEEHPDDYQYERAQRLGVTQTGIWHALKRLGVTYKKSPDPSQSGPRKAHDTLPETGVL